MKNDLFNKALNNWFKLETEAVKAAEAVKNNAEDLTFYAQLVQCAAEQAEVAESHELESAVRYLKSQFLHLEESVQLKSKLEEKAESTRRAADALRWMLPGLVNF